VRLDGYIRVSQVRGREGASFISPAKQREQIERWAKLRDVEIAEWHTDLDESGAKKKRPELMRALSRVEDGATGGIVVAKLDRFARSLRHALEAIQRIHDAGGVFSSVVDAIDPASPWGKMQMNVMLSFAEFELDRYRENWWIAREDAVVNRGIHIASRTPTGYERREDRVLVPHPEFGPVIAEVFRRRANGASWRELCALLDERGVVGPYNGKRWTTRAVQHLLENRVYLGEARHGAFSNVEAHEALTDRSTWERAQSARAAPTARSDDPALLAGLLRCGGCRYVMKPDSQRLRSGEKVRLYRCRGDHAAERCEDRAAVLGTVIEPFVEELFFAHAGERTATAEERDARVDDLERELVDAEAQLRAYRDDTRIADVLGRERYVEGLKVRADAVDDATRSLAEAQTTAPRGVGRAEMTQLWPDPEVRDRQALLASFIDAVFLRSGKGLPIDRRALILWRGQAPDDLPTRGRRVPLEPFVWPVESPDDARVASA